MGYFGWEERYMFTGKDGSHAKMKEERGAIKSKKAFVRESEERR